MDDSNPHRFHDLFSSLLHREAAELIKRDNLLLEQAKNTLLRWKAMHGEQAVVDWDEWLDILAEGPDTVLATMTAPDERAMRLRQSSPFSCLVAPRRRWALLDEAKGEKGRS
jgi:hypothetical protein